MKLRQVEVCSKIPQNHSFSPYEVISGHYLPCKLKLGRSWESVRTLLKLTRLAYRKSYLAIIGRNSHEKLTKYEIRASYYLGDTESVVTNAVVLVLGEYQIAKATYLRGYTCIYPYIKLYCNVLAIDNVMPL